MAFTNKFARLGGASLLALSIGIASAEAATLVGLTADNKLVKIDTATMAASRADGDLRRRQDRGHRRASGRRQALRPHRGRPARRHRSR